MNCWQNVKYELIQDEKKLCRMKICFEYATAVIRFRDKCHLDQI